MAQLGRLMVQSQQRPPAETLPQLTHIDWQEGIETLANSWGRWCSMALALRMGIEILTACGPGHRLTYNH
jgi:hypothetical protein